MTQAHGPVETSPGRRMPSSTGDRVVVGLFVALAVAIGVVAVVTVLGGSDPSAAVASPSAAPSATTRPTPRPTPAPTPTPTEPPMPSFSAEASPVFLTPDPNAPIVSIPPPDPAADPWTHRADHLRGRYGEVHAFSCPAGGPAGDPFYAVWGSNPYTDDSFVCWAAVHAGLTTVGEGGEVRIEVLPGMSSYRGSFANGVDTMSYGAWSGSYRVLLP